VSPNVGAFWKGLAAAVGYGAAWYWVRKDIVRQYTVEIAAAKAARAEEAARERGGSAP
jgi:hypothetical protein